MGVQIVSPVILGLLKSSICILLARIFFVRPFQVAVRVVMGICIAWTVMSILTFFICTPLSSNWAPQRPGGHCGNQKAAYVAVGVVNVTTDMMILCLPVPMVWRLQIPTANKAALSGLFGIGILWVCVFLASSSLFPLVSSSSHLAVVLFSSDAIHTRHHVSLPTRAAALHSRGVSEPTAGC